MEAAAAEYRKRLADRERAGPNSRKGTGGGPQSHERAASIQSKVKSLLDENTKPHVTRTAEGYGRYTNAPGQEQASRSSSQLQDNSFPSRKSPSSIPIRFLKSPYIPSSGTMSEPPDLSYARTRPSAPPKPQNLRTGGQAPLGAPSPLIGSAPSRRSTDLDAGQGDDWETDFSKRYPSLWGSRW